MALRDELISLVDQVRDEVIDGEVGLRLHAVVVRRRTWSGGEPGRGTPSDVDVVLTPKPKVSNPPPRLVMAEGGKYRDGDRIVSRISATYTAGELSGGTVGADEQFYWLIDGVPYTVVGEPEERYLGWRVQLRAGRDRQPAP